MVEGNLRIPSYAEFARRASERMPTDLKLGGKGTRVNSDLNELVIQRPDAAPVSVSLDKMYRYFVDKMVTYPDWTEDQLWSQVESYVDGYRTRVGREPIFKVKPALNPGGGVMIEQCCIR